MPAPPVAQPSFPALTYRSEANHWGRRKRVARVADLMTKIRKLDQLHPGRDIAAVKRRRGDLGRDTPQGRHTHELFQVARGAEKKRGKMEWMASQRVMKFLYDDWGRKARRHG